MKRKNKSKPKKMRMLKRKIVKKDPEVHVITADKESYYVVFLFIRSCKT